MPAKIHVERMMHRTSVMVAGALAASYALVKLIPAAEGGNKRFGLNLALVLDVSGSMHEYDATEKKRIERVQRAAAVAITKLKPDDRLAIVAFAHEAKLLLPSTTLADRAAIDRVIEEIENADLDPGGTAMGQGIQLALKEVERNAASGLLSQVVVLTDGETAGEQLCRQLAQQAAQKEIHLTLMGVGTEWNAVLLKDLAQLSEGKWYYIDVNQAQETERIFLEEFSHLAAVAFTNVQMHLRPVKDVGVKRVRQVVPEIKELVLTELEDRHYVASLGTLGLDKASRYILDLSLPRRPDGKYVIAQFEVTYDMGNGRRETTGLMPLEMQYTAAGHGYINAEVAKHIDEVQIFEMNSNLQEAIATDNKAEVRRLAENIARKGSVMGPRAAKKTLLARQVLQELNAGGWVSRKTQLAVDDAARLAGNMPV